MLTEAELLEAYRDTESDRVERTRSANDPDKIREFICALANDLPGHGRPGVIFIGQKDDLSCANLSVDDALLLKLSQLRDDGTIIPVPQLEVRKLHLDGCTVAAMLVAPSVNPPVKFSGRVWIRVGPRRALATGQEERRLIEKRQWGNLPFDAQPVLGSSLDDLDLTRFQLEFLPAVIPQDVLTQNQRTIEQQLSALRMVGPGNRPTATGILFAGKSPLTWLPGAFVQFRRVDGTKLTDTVLDVHEVSGTLPDQLRQLDELVALNIRTKSVIGGAKRTEYPDYPIEALRQLIRNAVIHRAYEGTNAPSRITWYTDRIEIQSPGGPFGQVTAENFGQGSTDYRNPTIAGLMAQLRLMERFGVGIEIARARLKDNGNPELEFVVNQQHVLAIVRPLL